jgi:alkylhydroperoxidase/carboxymuconolactone decarboxylase family protein YurZ
MRLSSRRPTLSSVDEVERLLRRLALNDEESVGMVLTNDIRDQPGSGLAPKVELLVRLGTLLALGGATASLRRAVDRAREAGASDAELVGVLIAAAPAMGLARLVAVAPRLAAAIGYELESDE